MVCHKPGEISLAHNGVLFLDELPEFKRTVLEVKCVNRMEERKVTTSTGKGCRRLFPLGFMLIASYEPLSCGFYNQFLKKNVPGAAGAVQKYLNKISGPLLDRIDLAWKSRP